PAELLEFLALEPEAFEDVPRLDGLETLQSDAALLAGDHLADVLLEVLEGGHAAFPELLAAARQLHPVAARDLAVDHTAAGDEPESRDLDRHQHLGPAVVDLAVGGLAQALGGPLHVLGQPVDD